ncbi:MAG: hypothetical protein GYB26_09345 [Gammaproteobacteria bacterium]|uniref:Uncharacterized protein n=1 Tax=Marinobacter litoralis TaxID=187981 RepID=A0A3M2RFL8_9GAMM|nr:hypothetical protein [Marinobacter litoralis]MBR9871329.1 hypothetical protein [Gammaproteobacteria bacterium]RMJ04106.1 hypothetical protein DOQ08_01426 [Marinobacter litoralis]
MATENDSGQPCLPGGLIPLDQWSTPDVSVRKTLRAGFKDILEQLRSGLTPESEAFESLDDLPSLSAKKLKRYAPEPDASAFASAILEQLGALRQQGVYNRGVSFIVVPPFSGVSEALLTLPSRVIEPPDNLFMTEQDADCWWDEQLGDDDWVVPELANFWLRHRSGLNLMKSFFARVALDSAGRGIVACSSWCWQFWVRYWPELHVGPLTLAPLDSERLTGWLDFLAHGGTGWSLTARMTNDGLYVLPPKTDESKEKYSCFMQDLANAARGNRGVAHAIWRRALRAKPEEDTEQDENGAGAGKTAECWVVPFDQLSLPGVPQSSGQQAGIVLHALLLHSGLTIDALELVTGITARELTMLLSRFLRADVIVQDENTQAYQLTPLGYPSVRKHLQARGFSVDGC